MIEQERLNEELQALYETYLRRLPETIAELRGQWQAHKTAEDLQRLLGMTHDLVSSTAAFGMVKIGECVRRLDQHLRCGNTIEAATVDALLQELAELSKTTPKLQQNAAFWATLNAPATKESPKTPSLHIIIIDDSSAGSQHLVDQLQALGHRCDAYDFAYFSENIGELLHNQHPDVLLVNTGRSKTDITGIEMIRTIRELVVPFPKVFFMSRHIDMQTRLTAVEAGGDAYFPLPLNMSELLESLRGLRKPCEQTPYRILVVEDNECLARYTALLLQRAGMETCVVTHPLQVLDQMRLFQPELVLLDISMPDCDGITLAKLIRQHTGCLGSALIFFADTGDIDQHIQTLWRNGDEFIAKPINPAYLVTAVAARAQRTRELLSLMMRDSLTGFLNHASFHEHLQREIMRANRYRNKLAYVIIDLDNFRAINERYGHAEGDTVLRCLAHVLRQRLRNTDIVCRNGGEEFVILMPETDSLAAAQIIDEMRMKFASVRNIAGEEEFTASFSAGVAEYPTLAQAVLHEAAEQALLRAKQAGRNQVERAPLPSRWRKQPVAE